MIRRVIAALLVAAAAPVAAQTVAITGGTVALGDGSEPIPNGTVVIRDGRIVAAGGTRGGLTRMFHAARERPRRLLVGIVVRSLPCESKTSILRSPKMWRFFW